MPSRYDDVLEKDWQQQVIDTMQYAGWKVAHFRTAPTRSGGWATPVQGDAVGFPDLFAIRPKTGDFLVVECKSERGRATPEQLQWLAWFGAAGVDAYLWRPSQVDEMIARVTR